MTQPQEPHAPAAPPDDRDPDLAEMIAHDFAVGLPGWQPVPVPFAPGESVRHRDAVDEAYKAWAATATARPLLEHAARVRAEHGAGVTTAAGQVSILWNECFTIARTAGPTAWFLVADRFGLLADAADRLIDTPVPIDELDEDGTYDAALEKLHDVAREHAGRLRATLDLIAARREQMAEQPAAAAHYATFQLQVIDKALTTIAEARRAGFVFDRPGAAYTDPAAAGDKLLSEVIEGLRGMDEPLRIPAEPDARFLCGVLHGQTVYVGTDRTGDGTAVAVLGFDDLGLEPIVLTRGDAEQTGGDQLIRMLDQRLDGLEHAREQHWFDLLDGGVQAPPRTRAAAQVPKGPGAAAHRAAKGLVGSPAQRARATSGLTAPRHAAQPATPPPNQAPGAQR